MVKTVLVDENIATELLPRRSDEGNKGSFGCLLSVCGSRDMTGAACLAGLAALRCGVGLLAVASVPEVLAVTKTCLWEAVNIPLTATEDGRISSSSGAALREYGRATAALMGCGMGSGAEGRRLILGMLERSSLPMVIDADGLNCLAGDFPDLKARSRQVIITPHIGEMERLTGIDREIIKRDRAQAAADMAEKYGVTVVLKDSVTHVASPYGRVYLISRPNSGLAKGGSGDVLAGCIASFLAQGVESLKAAVLGASVHNLAGAAAAVQLGKYAMLPRDVIDFIPKILMTMESLQQ